MIKRGPQQEFSAQETVGAELSGSQPRIWLWERSLEQKGTTGAGRSEAMMEEGDFTSMAGAVTT
jgi:hypothetical protein